MRSRAAGGTSAPRDHGGALVQLRDREAELPRGPARDLGHVLPSDAEGRVAVLPDRRFDPLPLAGRERLAGHDPDHEILEALLHDLELDDAGRSVEEMGEELAVDRLARGAPDDVGATPDHAR